MLDGFVEVSERLVVLAIVVVRPATIVIANVELVSREPAALHYARASGSACRTVGGRAVGQVLAHASETRTRGHELQKQQATDTNGVHHRRSCFIARPYGKGRAARSRPHSMEYRLESLSPRFLNTVPQGTDKEGWMVRGPKASSSRRKNRVFYQR